MRYVHYSNDTRVAREVNRVSGRSKTIEVRGDINLSFFLGKANAGATVRVFSDALDEDDMLFTAVNIWGWTVPIPVESVRDDPPA